MVGGGLRAIFAVWAAAAFLAPGFAGAGEIKIGYIIPDATDNWWQREWDGAQEAADKFGFALIKTEATDADRILAALDNHAAQGVQGILFATPETKLGPAVKNRCAALGVKLYSIANQFEDAEGKVMTEVHYSGVAAYDIGVQVGEAMFAEATRRGWKWEDTALMAMTIEELATAMERIGGCRDTLVKRGFPRASMYDAPIRSWDSIGSFNAADVTITQHPEAKNWFVTASNDPIVVGAVRALEGRGYKTENIIGVGINGGQEARIEFEKTTPSGFFASVFMSGHQHGYRAAESMYRWIRDGEEPPLDYRLPGTLVDRSNFREIMK
jgi:L-arabinose transport system substrate-binding protein